ncbi:MAG: winged helix-turn-helix domain-containing protein [Candidatus Thorarchaeota archaeon]
MDNIEGMTEFLKSIAHPKRIQILTLLSENIISFNQLRRQTNLQKTALSNNLTTLIDTQLIERFERGNYRITQDGRDLLTALSQFYEKAQVRKIYERKRIQQYYSQQWRKKMMTEITEKKTSYIPEYQPCWISYLGAVSGILKVFGKEGNIIDVGGYSGWSFLVNVAKGSTCPSGPTAHKAYDEILTGTQALGFELAAYDDRSEYGDIPEDWKDTPPEVRDERYKKFFNKFKEEFDKKQSPVVLWGIPIPEYGIAYGYKGDSYLVSTFRQLQGIPETPIPYNKLEAPGTLHYFAFGKELEVNPKDRDKEAIKRAIRMTEGETYAHDNYIAGPDAFVEWAMVLKTGKKEEELVYHGNSYVAQCALEGRYTAELFLKGLAKRYEDKSQYEQLIQACNEFSKSRDLLEEFVKIFPFGFGGKFPENKRKQGTALLLKIKPHELKAIEHLKEAVQVWD